MPVLPLPALPAGEEILIDANIIVYGLGRQSLQCADLLARCARREVSGFTTVDILSDVCHRAMLAEAAGLGLIARPNAANLKVKTHVVRQLHEYWRRVQQIRAGALAVLPFDEHRFHHAYSLRATRGLMTNDSMVLAAAEVFGIASLATNESDFDAIGWLNIYRPTDLI